MSGGGSTTTTSSQPPAAVQQAYQNLTNAAFTQSQQPLQQYTGPLVAGFTPQQQQGFQTVANSSGIAQPFINAGAQEFAAATTPMYQTVQNYESPYTTDVTNSLQGLFNQQNAQQLQQVQGNATQAGAYGGDREAVAQALTAQQQQLAEAPTLANTLQQGYQTALSANQAQNWLASQAGFGLPQLGLQAQQSALTGANANISAGGLQQQLAQEQLNIPYEQFMQQQAYPYQQLQFLAPIVEGTGSLSGGTGSTTVPGPSALSQIAGLGTAGAGLYGLGSNLGWFGGGASTAGADLGALAGSMFGAKKGGRIGYAPGGMIPMTNQGMIPDVSLSIIPPMAMGKAGANSMGLSPFTPVTTQTTSGGGGGGLSDLLGVAGLVTHFLKSGGRAGFQTGGAPQQTIPGQQNPLIQPPTQGGLPAVPAIGIDHLINPGPAIKGSGPPRPPQPAPAQDPSKDASGLLSGMQSLQKEGLLGGSDGTTRQGFQTGGASLGPETGPIEASSPNVQGYFQQLMGMSPEQLQEMSVRMPPGSPYAQLVQRALMAKRMNTVSPVAQPSPSYAQTGQPGQEPAAGLGIGTGMGITATGQSAPSSGATSHPAGMAEGGEPGSVGEGELDPVPVVDHSGDTVRVRYPSEGRTLNLGLPSIRPRPPSFAAGGSPGPASGNGAFVPPSLQSFYANPGATASGFQWNVTGPTGATSPPPLVPPATAAANAPPGISLFQAPNGVSIPQVNANLITGGPGVGGNPTVAPGGGLAGWFQGLPQLQNPGGHVASTAPLNFGTPNLAGVTAPVATPVAAPIPYDPNMGLNDAGGMARGGRTRLDDGGVPDPTGMSAAFESAPDQYPYIPGVGVPVSPSPIPLPDVGLGPPPGNYSGATPAYATPKGGFQGGNDPFQAIGRAVSRLQEPVKPDVTAQQQQSFEAPFTPLPPAPKPGAAPPGDLTVTGGTSLVPGGAATPMPALPPASSTPTQDLFAEARSPTKAPGLGADPTSGQLTSDLLVPTPADDTGAAPSAGAAPPAPRPAAPVFVGDSIAEGLKGAANGSGPTHVGWRPDQVLGAFTGADFKGAPVYISSGVSNDPTMVGLVPRQIQAAHSAGAGSVAVYGVGEGVPNYQSLNERLSQMAAANGARFIPLAGTEGGRVHPRSYPAAWQASQVAPPTGVAAAPPATGDLTAGAGNIVAGRVSQAGPGIIQSIVQTAKAQGDSTAAMTGIIANGLGEGGYNEPWQKAWGTENSFGHWQFNQNGELPGYEAWLKQQGAPNTSANQYRYVSMRMNQIHPGFSQITDPKLATDLVATEFERYKGAAPGQRYGLIPNAEQIIAGNYSGGLGPRGHGGGAPDTVLANGQTDPSAQAAAQLGTGAERAAPGSGPTVQTVAERALDQVAPEHRSAMAQWMDSPYFLAFLAGAGMLASRSPFPGVALGQGLEFAAKGMQTQQAQDVREHQIANEAAYRQQNLGLEQQRLAQTGQYQNQEIAVRQATAQRQIAAEDQRFQAEMARLHTQDARDQEIARHNHAVEAINAAWHEATATKPLPGYQTGPNGEIITGTQSYNPLTNQWEFKAGATVGHPTRPTEYTQKQAAWLAIHPNDAAGALAYANGQRQMSPQQMSIAAQNLAEKDMAGDVSTMGMSPAQRQARLQQLTEFHLGQMGATAPAAPAAQAPQAPAPAPAAPAWATQSAVGPNGQRIFFGNGAWRNANGAPYQPAAQ